MTVLVTGGTGFLGSYLVRYLVQDAGQEVVVFDRYVDRARLGEAAEHVRVVEGDIRDADALSRVVRDHGVRRIAHMASLLGNPRMDRLAAYVDAVCGGFVNVMTAAADGGVERVLFASSVSAYGTRDRAVYTEVDPSPEQLLTEDDEGSASDAYAASKLWGEAMGTYCGQRLDVGFVTVRFGSTFGLGRSARGSYRSGLVAAPNSGHFMARVERAARGEPIVMPTDRQIVDWTYAADAAQAAWLALSADHPRHRLYNVAGERRPIGDFTRRLRQLLPGVSISTDDEERASSEHRFMDASRIRSELGFAPRFTLESGLEDYIARLRAYDVAAGE